MERETKFKSMFKMSIKFILIFVIGLTTCITIYSTTNAEPLQIEYRMKDTVEYIDSDIKTDSIFIFPHLEIKSQLIAEVDKYITSKTRGKHNKKLAEYLVNNSIEHNIDLCFMMSQTQNETNFGTAGIGKASSKKSLFGVMRKHYKNYDEAVKDYCKLLKKSYLTKGRTEQDLMKRFVNSSGRRYAGNPNYETHLRSVYKNINVKTEINKLQKLYNKLYKEYLASLDLQKHEEDIS